MEAYRRFTMHPEEQRRLFWPLCCNLKKESICQPDKQRKSGLTVWQTSYPPDLRPGRFLPLSLQTDFSPLEHRSSSGSLHLPEQILRNVRLRDFSVAPYCVCHRMDPFPHPWPPEGESCGLRGRGKSQQIWEKWEATEERRRWEKNRKRMTRDWSC